MLYDKGGLENLVNEFTKDEEYDVADAYHMALEALLRGDHVLVAYHTDRAQEHLARSRGWDGELVGAAEELAAG